MSSVVVALLFIFAIFMLFLLLSIVMFTIALLIFSPRDKTAKSHEMREKELEKEDV
jgi:hypothetical protein